MNTRKRLTFFILVTILAMLACSTFGGESATEEGEEPSVSGPVNTPPGEMPEAETPDTGADLPDGLPSMPGTDFEDLLSVGDIELTGIQGNADGETTGPVITMTLTNTTDEEITINIPCGLVFSPTDGDTQPMMVVQPVSLALAAGETQEVTPFVICVDIAAAAPDTSTSFTIGYMAADDMLAFAECICGEELTIDGTDTVGVQFAAWSIQLQGDFASTLMEEGSAAGEFLEGEDMEAMNEMFMQMMEMFATEWLDKCGIVITPAD